MNQEVKSVKKENIMRLVRLDKVVLSCGAVGPDLEKAKRLLEFLTNEKAQIMKAGPKRRIPAFSVKPDMPLGTMVTLRGDKASEVLKKLLGAINNELDESQISENAFSFGIHEYIEIPGIEYQREIGIRGLNVTVVFTRAGMRVKKRKIKRGRVPHRQNITQDEIINYMEENFNTEIE